MGLTFADVFEVRAGPGAARPKQAETWLGTPATLCAIAVFYAVASLIDLLVELQWTWLLATVFASSMVFYWSPSKTRRPAPPTRAAMAGAFGIVACRLLFDTAGSWFRVPATLYAALGLAAIAAVGLARVGRLSQGSRKSLVALVVASALWGVAYAVSSPVLWFALWCAVLAAGVFAARALHSVGGAAAAAITMAAGCLCTYTVPMHAPTWVREAYWMSALLWCSLVLARFACAEVMLTRLRTAAALSEATTMATLFAAFVPAAVWMVLRGGTVGWAAGGAIAGAVGLGAAVHAVRLCRRASADAVNALHVYMLGGATVGVESNDGLPASVLVSRLPAAALPAPDRAPKPEHVVFVISGPPTPVLVRHILAAVARTGLPPDTIVVDAFRWSEARSAEDEQVALATVLACRRAGATTIHSSEDAAEAWITSIFDRRATLLSPTRDLTGAEADGHRGLLELGPPHLAVGAASLFVTPRGALLARRAMHHLQELIEVVAMIVAPPERAGEHPVGDAAWHLVQCAATGDRPNDLAAMALSAELSPACRWSLSAVTHRVVSDLPAAPDGSTLGAWHPFLRRLRNRMEHPGIPPEVLQAHPQISEALVHVAAAVAAALLPLWRSGRVCSVREGRRPRLHAGLLGTVVSEAAPTLPELPAGVYWLQIGADALRPPRPLAPWMVEASDIEVALPADYCVVQRVQNDRPEFRLASVFRSAAAAGPTDVPTEPAKARENDVPPDVGPAVAVPRRLPATALAPHPPSQPPVGDSLPSASRRRRVEPVILWASLGTALAASPLLFQSPWPWMRALAVLPIYGATLLGLGVTIGRSSSTNSQWIVTGAGWVGAIACHLLLVPVSPAFALLAVCFLQGSIVHAWVEAPERWKAAWLVNLVGLASLVTWTALLELGSLWRWGAGAFCVVHAVTTLPWPSADVPRPLLVRRWIHRVPSLARLLAWPGVGWNVLQLGCAAALQGWLWSQGTDPEWFYSGQALSIVLLWLALSEMRRALVMRWGPACGISRRLDPATQHDRALIVFGPDTPFREVRALRRLHPERFEAIAYGTIPSSGYHHSRLYAGAVVLGPAASPGQEPDAVATFYDVVGVHPGVVPIVVGPPATVLRRYLGALGIGLDATLAGPAVRSALDVVPAAVRPLLHWWGSFDIDVLASLSVWGPPLLARRMRVLTALSDRGHKIRELLALFEEHVRVVYCFAAALAGTAANGPSELGPAPAFGTWATCLRRALAEASRTSQVGAELQRRLTEPKIDSEKQAGIRTAISAILGRDALESIRGPLPILVVVESLIALRNALAHRRLDATQDEADRLVGLLHGLYMDLIVSSAPLIAAYADVPMLTAGRVERHPGKDARVFRPLGVRGSLLHLDDWHVDVEGLPAEVPEGAVVLLQQLDGQAIRYAGRLDPLIRIEAVAEFVDWVVFNRSVDGSLEYSGWAWAPLQTYARQNPLKAPVSWRWPAPEAEPPVPLIDRPDGVKAEELTRLLDCLARTNSLSEADRRRILHMADQITPGQLRQLHGIFDEERQKFGDLWDTEPVHIPALCRLALRGHMTWAAILCGEACDALEVVFAVTCQGVDSLGVWGRWPDWWVALGMEALRRDKDSLGRAALQRALEASTERTRVIAAVLRDSPLGTTEWLGDWLLEVTERQPEALAHVAAWCLRSDDERVTEQGELLLEEYWSTTTGGHDGELGASSLLAAADATLLWSMRHVPALRLRVDAALAVDPDSAVHWTLRGRLALEHDGDVATGERCLSHAINLDEEAQDAWSPLAQSRRVHGDDGPSAVAIVEAGRRAVPGISRLEAEAVLAARVSGSAADAKRLAQAVIDLLAAVESDPRHASDVGLEVCALSEDPRADGYRREVERIARHHRRGSAARDPLLLDALVNGSEETVDRFGRELPGDLSTQLRYWSIAARVYDLAAAFPARRPMCARYLAAHLTRADEPRMGAPPSPALRRRLAQLAASAEPRPD